MWIVNVSKQAVEVGRLPADPGPNSMLIQIMDPDEKFPICPVYFPVVKQYNFHDADPAADARNAEYLQCNPSEFYSQYMTPEQARKIVDDLKYALDNGMNVVVHCHAGVCRSGAVAEVGEMMGFEPMGAGRIPNTHVKSLLIDELGWSYG